MISPSPRPVQPWYSLGLVCLAAGLLFHLFAPAGVAAAREFIGGVLIGMGLVFLLTSLWRGRMARRGGRA